MHKIVSAKTFVNLSTLFSGTLLSTIIPILFAPVMTRIFTASDYGVLGLYMSISGLLGVLAYIHYPQAIMLSKNDETARQVMWFSMGFSVVVALLSLAIIGYLYLFTNWPAASPLRFWLLFIPLSVFFNGISASIMVWANRHQQYKILASNRIVQSILTVVIQISFGLLINNETGLVLGLMGGQFTSAFLLWLRFNKSGKASLNKPKLKSFKSVAFEYRNLLFYSTPSNFINNLINQTPIFLLQKFGGIAYVGSYNFTQRILGMPQLLFSSAVVEVFKQKASTSYNETGNCRNVFIKTFKALGLMAIIPFTLIILLAPPVFAFVFGEEWRQAGVFAQFLGILFFFRFVVSPLTYVYIIVGKLKENFWMHVLFLLITTLSFYVGDYFLADKEYLILTYSLTYSLVYLVYLFRSFQLSKDN